MWEDAFPSLGQGTQCVRPKLMVGQVCDERGHESRVSNLSRRVEGPDLNAAIRVREEGA